jgi:hypothetical protein
VDNWGEKMWSGAVIHLLVCKKTVEDCPLCKAIQKQVAEDARYKDSQA